MNALSAYDAAITLRANLTPEHAELLAAIDAALPALAASATAEMAAVTTPAAKD